jgi:hypothetical protein
MVPAGFSQPNKGYDCFFNLANQSIEAYKFLHRSHNLLPLHHRSVANVSAGERFFHRWKDDEGPCLSVRECPPLRLQSMEVLLGNGMSPHGRVHRWFNFF